MKSDPEPLGAGFYPDGAESGFTLISRGDRVRGRLARPKGSAPHPLILVAAPDGCAKHASVDALIAAWSSWAAVAAIDLPLCGARRSDKLSLSSFEKGDSIATRIRRDVEIQVESDLERTFAFLGAERAAFFGSGLGADLAIPFCRNASGLLAIALAPTSLLDVPLGDGRRTCSSQIFAPNPPPEEVAEFLKPLVL